MTGTNKNGRDLIVVIPVYNEEASIRRVVQEWYTVLEVLEIDYQFLIVNDGSTDSTTTVLAQLAGQFPVVDVITKANSGHGQSCLTGYREAIARRARWVFQIDSDGQCDPHYFPTCWQLRDNFPVVFGQRVQRDDGLFRVLISAMNRLIVWLATGVDVPDSNVPYRLMKRDVLETAVSNFPQDFYLANILLAVILQKGLEGNMKHVPIGFRQRYGGEASVKWDKFFTLGRQLFRSLRHQQRQIQQRSHKIQTITSVTNPVSGTVGEVSL